MSDTTPILKRRYYPRLSSILNEDEIPDSLGFIKDGIISLFNKIHFKDLQFSKSPNGDGAAYRLSIVSPHRLDLELPGTGIHFILNPDITGGDFFISSFPISIQYQWKILAYLRGFDLSDFSFDPQSIYETLLRVLNLTEEQVLAHFINCFVLKETETITFTEQFVNDINEYLDSSIPAPTESTSLREIAEQIYDASEGQYSSTVVFGCYLLSEESELTLKKLKLFFNGLLPQNIDNYIRDLVIPSFRASLQLTAAIEFPRNLLIPVYPEGTILSGEDVSLLPLPDPAKAMFSFAEAMFSVDSSIGLGYSMDLAINTVHPVQIGNTGLILNIQNLKVDLSTSTNIPEAADRPLDFMGVYVEKAEVILPPKWFAADAAIISAPKIFGKRLLIGTGGISGKIGMEGNGLLIYTFTNGLVLELSSFDITFDEGAIVSSSVLGLITIPSFENNPLNVELDFENGFNIKVFAAPPGVEIINNEHILTTLNKLEIGRQDAVWKLSFIANFLMKRELPLLSKVFPKKIDINQFLFKSDGTLNYDLRFEWLSGASVSGNHERGLTAVFPVKLSVGKDLFNIDSILLTIKKHPDNDAIEAQMMLEKVGFNLGPVSGSVDGFGMNVQLNQGDIATNNLGSYNYQLDFIGPTGAALKINAGAVTGGGFLRIDKHEYIGSFALTIKNKFGLSVLGILTTKLPEGREGYSLLMIVTAEFGSIPLGMGFTLNGLGGLLGLHRTMNPDILRSGIRDNTLDYILFPQNVNKDNVSTYIGNIARAFPVQEGNFLVGPMAKIGWGTPTLLTIDLGIILEFPDPVRLAILGVLKALLPDKNKTVLQLQVNFLGIIDFTNKYLSFDASLFDSKILTYSLVGDMALRLYWGDKPNFLLSVGGFHPKYTPPPLNLPELRRLSIVLANHEKLKISVEAYFAITSNSAQFGAKVMAVAKAWKVEAVGALWFDILFRFSPFYFIADMGAMFGIRYKSKELLTIFINLTLEGPNPWRARGLGTFKVLGFKVNVPFDKTFGTVRTETIDPIAIDSKFTEAVGQKDNWEALLPSRSHQQIAWSKNAEMGSGLIVDAGGQLKFSQKLMPLNTELKKFGTAPISDFKKYTITNIQSGSITLDLKTTHDLFARNEYVNMSDDEKLSKDSYELFDSGVLIGDDQIESEYAVHKLIDYEDIVIDTGHRQVKPRWILQHSLMEVHTLDNYVGKSLLSDYLNVSNSDGPATVAVSIEQESFVLVDRNTMSIMDTALFSNSVDAESALSGHVSSGTSGVSDWMVVNTFELDF